MPSKNPDNPFNAAWDEHNHGQNFDWFREAFDPETARFARDKLASTNMPSQIANSNQISDAIDAGRDAAPRANPYDLGLGNLARDGYVQALERLHNGTSTVMGQANRAMGQLGGQVNAATANTSRGLGQMKASGMGALGGAALADQAGQARLSEFTNQQNAYGAGLASLRGQDTSMANAQQASGLAARGQDDNLQGFYNDKAADLRNLNADLDLNRYKLGRRIDLQKQGKNQQTGADVAQVLGSILKLLGIG